MRIDTFHTVIHSCRFCFMCRHLSPVGNVTFRESDTPRGRALMLDSISRQPALLDNADFVGTLYDAELSAACRTHCVSHFDEAGLVLAARADVVDAGKAPESIRALAEELSALAPLGKGDRNAEAVYFIDRYTELHQPEIAAAMSRLFKSAGVSFRVISGADSGKALAVLGFHDAAKKVAATVASLVNEGSAKLLIASCPAAFDAFKNDYAALGAPLNAGIEVLHSSEWIERMIESGKLERPAVVPGAVYPLPSDYLRNYNNGNDAPARAARALGAKTLRFGHNDEESYAVGEGAVVYDRINPRIAGKLVERVLSLMDNRQSDVLLVASPYAKHVLKQYGGAALRVLTIEEIAAGNKE